MKSYLAIYWNRFRHLSIRRKLLPLGLVILLFLIIVPVVTYAQLSRDISDPERLMNRNNTGIVLLDRSGEPFYSFGRTNYQNGITLSEISDRVEHAIIASEDKDFYNHPGVSAKGAAAALYANVLNKDLTKYGGSTITQQLVDNTLISSGKNFFRKYQEVSMAVAVERRYSKEQILEMYLNSVYFGEGAFGIGPAAKTYFNKSPEDLTLAESSMLAGLLPAPSSYSPISGDKQKAKINQERVLSQMVSAGYISSSEKDRTLEEELTYADTSVATNKSAQHFALMVLDELKKRYGEEKATRSGYVVTTTLDLNWQEQALQYVRQRVDQLKNQGGTNASLVAIDPRSGDIKALVGSIDWEEQTFGKVNMALAARQPGSSFKPIYYTESFDKRLITPATILHDVPKSYGTYAPLNYDFRFRGDISVRRALALSLNLPAVEVMEKLGPHEASAAAQRMGISTINEPEKYGLSLALGTAEARLLEMTNAYAALANQGNQFPTSSILSIKDKFDKNIYEHEAESKRVTSPEASFLTSSILSDAEARAPTFNSLNIPGRQVAAKTGTTDNNRDAWTIGYTPSVAVGVWVGNNANQPMSGVAGASGAGPLWKNSMVSFLRGSNAETFNPPTGIVKALVCASNGFRADRPDPGTYTEFFIAGTVPKERCNVPRPPERKDDDEDKKEEQKPPEKKKEDKPNEEGGRGGGQEPPKEEKPPKPNEEEPPEEDDDEESSGQPSPSSGNSNSGSGGGGSN